MPSVKTPLHIKKHRDLSKHEYKQDIHVVNETNYLIAMYESQTNTEKTIRDYRIVNLLDAAEYFKKSNSSHRENYPIVEDVIYQNEFELKHKFNLKTGMKVIILKNNEQDINFADISWLHSRLYVVRGIDADGIKLYHHQEARQTTDVIKHMNEVINRKNISNNILDKNGKIKISKLTTPKGGDMFDKFKDFSYIKFKVSNFNALIEGVDFIISDLGNIKQV